MNNFNDILSDALARHPCLTEIRHFIALKVLHDLKSGPPSRLTIKCSWSEMDLNWWLVQPA